MSPNRTDHNDTKLLLAVGALVVAGAAGIAMIAGLSLDEPSEEVASRTGKEAMARARPALAVQVDPPPATPVLFETPLAEPPVEPEVADVVAEPVFRVDPTEDPIARGTETYEAGEYGHAAAYFAAAIDGAPERAWTHYMLALSLWKDGRAEEAAPAMETSARLDPASIKARVNLARIRNDLGDYAAALEAAEAALQIDDADASALFLAARSLYNLGLVDDCVVKLEASIQADPDNGYARNLLGLARLDEQRTDDAVIAFEAAAGLVPQVAFVQNNLGMALELSGRTEEAVAAYRRSVEVDPNHARAVANLARLDPVPCDADADADAAPDAGELAEAGDDEVLELARVEGEVEP